MTDCKDVFISYRREDEQGYRGFAGWFYTLLEQELGADRIFKDVEDGLKPGDTFPTELDRRIAECAVVLALIGPRWLHAKDTDGNRRLDHENDWVRQEIVQAMALHKRVIPILIGGAELPDADALPTDLKPFTMRQAHTLSEDDFAEDAKRLIAQLPSTISGVRAEEESRAEQILWDQVKDTTAADALQGFLQQFPSGSHADDAKRRLRKLRNPGRRLFFAGVATVALLGTIAWQLRSDDENLKSEGESPAKTTLRGHRDSVRSIAFLPNSREAVSASMDQSLVHWDLTTGKAVESLVGHLLGVVSVVTSVNGSRAISAAQSDGIRIWDLDRHEVVASMEVRPSIALSLAFSPVGDVFVSAGYRILQLQRATDLALIWQNRDPGHVIRAVAFFPDGRAFLTGSDDAAVRVWNAKSGELVRELGFHTAPIRSVAVSSDGASAISGSLDGTVGHWSLTRDKSERFNGHIGAVNAVAFLPDRRSAISGGDDKTVRLWDTNTGQYFHVFHGHEFEVESVAVSPDGSTALTGDAGGVVRVWDLRRYLRL